MENFKSFVMWLKWLFFVIPSCEKAKSMNLTHYGNIHGDAINHMNCRSIWIDSFGRTYRCAELKLTT